MSCISDEKAEAQRKKGLAQGNKARTIEMEPTATVSLCYCTWVSYHVSCVQALQEVILWKQSSGLKGHGLKRSGMLIMGEAIYV